MNETALQLIDRTLTYSLWAFLITFLILLIFAIGVIRSRRRRLGEVFADGTLDRVSQDRKAASLLNEWRILFHSFLLALGCTLVFAAVYTLVPIPFVDNLLTTRAWQVTPLRVTALTYDRFYEGFSLEGDVWNQTEEPIEGLQAVVTVVGSEDTHLDELQSAVRPDPLEPGEMGSFQVEYRKQSPFIQGYRIRFVNPSGQTVPHVAGFDVR
jgi:hypothetical protein